MVLHLAEFSIWQGVGRGFWFGLFIVHGLGLLKVKEIRGDIELLVN